MPTKWSGEQDSRLDEKLNSRRIDYLKLGTSSTKKGLLLATRLLGFAFVVQTVAQVQTTTTTSTEGQSSYKVTVNRGEVRAVGR